MNIRYHHLVIPPAGWLMQRQKGLPIPGKHRMEGALLQAASGKGLAAVAATAVGIALGTVFNLQPGFAVGFAGGFP